MSLIFGAQALGPFCAFLSSATWAYGTTRYSRLSLTYPPFAINFTRALVALPLFLLTSFLVAGGIQAGFTDFSQIRFSHLGWFTLSMISGYGIGDVLFLWSTRSLGIPGALAIASCYPVFMALTGILFRGETLVLSQALGVLMSVAGVVTVILSPTRLARVPAAVEQDQAATPNLSKKWVGVLLALGTSIFWGINSFSVARGGVDLSAPVANSLRMVLALIITFSLGRAWAPGTRFVLPRPVLQASAGVFAVEAFGGSYFFMYGLAHSPLVLGSTLTSLAPVLSVPIAWVMRTEKPSAFKALGVCLVVIGIWLLLSSSH